MDSIQLLIEIGKLVGSAAVVLIILAQVYVHLTPTPDDDAKLGQFLKGILPFIPVLTTAEKAQLVQGKGAVSTTVLVSEAKKIKTRVKTLRDYIKNRHKE
jgi:hypothetical protein